MSENWTITVLHSGTGVIEHRGTPRFQALWTTGLAGIVALDGLVWTDEGHGEADAITLYGFRWDAPMPPQDAFEALMCEAVNAIDTWIAARL